MAAQTQTTLDAIHRIPRRPTTQDLSGQVFHYLTILSFFGYSASKAAYWECQCQCGTFKVVGARHLRSHRTLSCGCWSATLASGRLLKHGYNRLNNRTPEYNAYMGARARCSGSTNPRHASYQKRGTQFLFSSFDEFIADIGDRPSADLSLDRIDNNGHYEKGNVRWGTEEQQARNKSSNRHITALGQTHILVEWSEITGLKRTTIERRIARGWCTDCSMTIPVKDRICPHKI